MSNKLKLFIIKLLRVCLRFFYIFPVNKKIFLFSSYEGRQYSDNPKYFYLYLKEKYGDNFKYIWVLNKKEAELKTVKFLSLKHIYYLMTAKYIISNLGIEPFIPKRKTQIFINTWHGSGAYKCQTLNEKLLKDKYTVNCRDYRAKNTNYYLSGCRKYSEVSSESWNVDISKFIPIGTTRNDIFFSNNIEKIRLRVFEDLGISPEYGYILYAPTFRGNSFRNQDKFLIKLNFIELIKVFEKRFNKKFKVLYREHIGFCKDINLESKNLVIDVSSYPDMQELMVISDALITDYSSSMWDFSLLNRPGFLYVPDIDDYSSKRDFYFPIETWPFQYSKTQEDLFKQVENYDEEKALLKIKEHHNNMGIYEKGIACESLEKILRL